MSFFKYTRTFFQLFNLNLHMLFKDVQGSLFDTFIWVSLSIFCNGYIYPSLGMASSYGSLIAVGHIVSSGVFLCYAAAMVLTSDFQNDRVINYELMLPLPSWMVFLKTALSWAVVAAIYSSIILPLGKIILLDKFSLKYFSFIKFIIAFLVINFFIGCFAIMTTGLNKDILSIKRVWVRFIYPLWFLGGSIFPFNTMIATYPKLALLLLFNPITYATELVRAAVFGPEAYYLPFWISAIILPVFSVVAFWIGYSRLKQRMDFF